MQTVSQTQGPFTRLRGCTSASLGWSRGPCVPNAPKTSRVCQRCFQPPLIFSHEGSARSEKAVGRQAQPRRQGAHPRRVGLRAGQGVPSRGPTPVPLHPPGLVSAPPALTSQFVGPGVCSPSFFTSGLGGFCFLFIRVLF